jgi:hypothetical protein
VNAYRLLLGAQLIALNIFFLAPALSQDCNSAAGPPGQGPLRAPLDVRPEAVPDSQTIESGKRELIDVLANDKGAPANSSIELQLEGTPSCGSAGVEGRKVWYLGDGSCVGKTIEFKYRAKLVDARTCEYEWRSAAVRVAVVAPPPAPTPTPTVTPAPARLTSCDIPNLPWQLLKIEGGRFVKSEAPATIADFANFIEEPTFVVEPFCLMVDEVSSEQFGKFFRTVSEAQKRENFPEALEENSAAAPPIAELGQSAAATRISYRMAEAYAKYHSNGSGRSVTMPTLNEYVAALWELQKRRPQPPQATMLPIALRSGNLQWTGTACPDSGTDGGNFLTLGPQMQGALSTICYSQSRRDRTGFRLIVR